MKKVLTLFFVLIFAAASVPQASAAYNKELDFKSNIVYMESLDRGTVIFNKNSKKRTAQASLTKITTAMVVLEKCKNLDAEVTVKTSVMDTFVGTNSSAAGIMAGEKLTVRQLLSLMLIKSANEAASILADYVGGDIDSFVKMMNDFARERGCKNTHYKNPHGLDEDGSYTTAEDLAKIIKYALKNKTFCELVSSPSYVLPDTNKRESVKYSNTNRLILPTSSYYYEPCKGIKTGTTDNAGHCLASYAVKNGYSYLCIIMQAPSEDSNGDGMSENYALTETVKAYEWAFDNIKLKVVASPSSIGPVVPIKLGRKTDRLRLVPAEEVTALLPSNADASAVLIEPVKGSVDPNLKAPVKAGEILGKARLKYAGETLCTVDLAAGEDVKLSIPAYIGYLIKVFFSSVLMKVLLVIALAVLLFYLLVNLLYARKMKRKQMKMLSGGSGREQISGRGTMRSSGNEQGVHPARSVGSSKKSIASRSLRSSQNAGSSKRSTVSGSIRSLRSTHPTQGSQSRRSAASARSTGSRRSTAAIRGAAVTRGTASYRSTTARGTGVSRGKTSARNKVSSRSTTARSTTARGTASSRSTRTKRK